MREGLDLPPKIANAPRLQLGLGLYFDAFWDLCSMQFTPMGVTEINWIVINDYCDRIGVEGDQREDMHHHVAVMSREFVAHTKRKED